MPATEPSSDVLIAGAGPTGLFLASELARHGVRARLIDKAAEPSRHSKALGVHARTLELFRLAGIVEPFLAQGVRAVGLSQYSGRSRLMALDFAGLDDCPYPFVLVLEQSTTERLFLARLAEQGVVAERPVELVGLSQDADGVTATLKRPDGATETARRRYLVGCDGAHSTTRHALGLPFEGSRYPLVFALADVEVRWGFPLDRLLIFHHADGVAAVFPLPGKKERVRLVFDTTQQMPDAPEGGHGPDDSKIPPPSLEDVQRLVALRIGPDVQVSNPEWLAHFRLHIRQVPRYREGRVFLAGDAAHIHSPIGGQGMNTGLQDASNLAWKLALAEQGRGTPALLDSYSTERHAVGKIVLATTDRMTRIMTLRNPLLRWGRNLLLRVLGLLPGVTRGVLRTVTMLALNYRGSPIVADLGARGLVRAGDRAPDATLVRGAEQLRLFDLLAGPGHHLLLFAPAETARSFREAWTRQGCADVPVHWIDELDAQRQARRHYGVGDDAAFLVRPDGYVGHASRPASAEAAAAHLRGLLVR